MLKYLKIFLDNFWKICIYCNCCLAGLRYNELRFKKKIFALSIDELRESIEYRAVYQTQQQEPVSCDSWISGGTMLACWVSLPVWRCTLNLTINAAANFSKPQFDQFDYFVLVLT